MNKMCLWNTDNPSSNKVEISTFRPVGHNYIQVNGQTDRGIIKKKLDAPMGPFKSGHKKHMEGNINVSQII